MLGAVAGPLLRGQCKIAQQESQQDDWNQDEEHHHLRLVTILFVVKAVVDALLFLVEKLVDQRMGIRSGLPAPARIGKLPLRSQAFFLEETQTFVHQVDVASDQTLEPLDMGPDEVIMFGVFPESVESHRQLDNGPVARGPIGRITTQHILPAERLPPGGVPG